LQDGKAKKLTDWQSTAGPPSCPGHKRPAKKTAPKPAPPPAPPAKPEPLEPDPHGRPAEACAHKHRKYVPDMKGHAPSQEWSLDKCQTRCSKTEFCAHYTYYTNKACHLQSKYSSWEVDTTATSGPPFCRADIVSLPSTRGFEAEDCSEKDTMWTPLDMPGSQPSDTDSLSKCQKRCAKTDDCVHFTVGADKLCHLQDDNAEKTVAEGHTSGPRKCKASKKA